MADDNALVYIVNQANRPQRDTRQLPLADLQLLLNGHGREYQVIDEAQIFELLAKNELATDAVFVVQHFEGEAFAALVSSDCRVIGANLMVSNNDNDKPLLATHHSVQFTNMMEDVTVHFAGKTSSSVLEHVLAEARNNTLWMGGQWASTYTNDVTHVVATEVDATVRDAVAKELPVLQLTWIEDCWEKATKGGIDLEHTYKSNALPALTGCVIYLDVDLWDVSLRNKLSDMAELSGARFTDCLDDATHYVTNKVDEQYEKAIRNNIYVVCSQWLIRSVTPPQQWLSEARFSLANLQSSPSRDRMVKRQRLSVDLSDTSTPLRSPRSFTVQKSNGKAATLSSTPIQAHALSADAASTVSTPILPPPLLQTKTPMTPVIRILSSTPDVPGDSPRGSVKRKREAMVLEDSKAEKDLNSSSIDRILDVKVSMKAEKRRHQALEMLEKEESYLASLTVIVELFINHLKSTGALDKQDMQLLFANVADIKPLTEHLVFKMKQIIERWDPEGSSEFGGLFDSPFKIEKSKTASEGTTKAFLRTVYKRYIAGHHRSKEFYDKIMNGDKKYHDAQTEIKMLETDLRCNRQRLIDMLMLPVQHLMRYPMHLENLLKSAPEGHLDKESIPKVLEYFGEATSEVNTAQEGMESTAELFKFLDGIQGKSPDCFKYGRKLVKEIKCQMLSAEKKTIKMMVFLMNDCLIIAERLDGAKMTKAKGTLSRKTGQLLGWKDLQSAPHGNLKFFGLYLLQDVHIIERDPGDSDHFFFSIESLGTNPDVNARLYFTVKSQEENRAFLKSCRDVRSKELNIELTEEEELDTEQFEKQAKCMESYDQWSSGDTALDKENDNVHVDAPRRKSSIFSKGKRTLHTIRRYKSNLHSKFQKSGSRSSLRIASSSNLNIPPSNLGRSKSLTASDLAPVRASP